MEARLCFRNIPVFVSRRAAGRRASISGAKRIPTVPCRPDGCQSCPAHRGLCCAEPAEPERADDQSGPARDVRFLPVRNREDTTIPSSTGSIITDRVRLWWTADRTPRGSRGSSLRPVNGTRLCAISSGANHKRDRAPIWPLREFRIRLDTLFGLMAYASGARALCRTFFESDDRPVHFVQVRPARQAEWQKRIDMAILGQLRGRELPQLHARFQGDFDEFSNHSVRFVHNVRRSKEPH